MLAKTLMVQGTSSDSGKSLLVAALCRIFAGKGVRVAPFKSQNMALNSFATLDGDEIGRAQALQADAARIEPTVDMNPILLKPTDKQRSQVIVRGKVYKTLSAREYYREKTDLIAIVEESLHRLRTTYDLVIIEGAGSPAEVNLKSEDIVNMRVAKLAKAPVLLVGDIDRGGVFASLVGTIELLEPDERAIVKGLIINKFRGDVTLLDSGIEFLTAKTGKPVLGIVPYLMDLKLDSEDSLALEKTNRVSNPIINIAIVRLPHIANFTDIDALAHEPGVAISYVAPGEPIDNADLVIIPGTKNTMEDMTTLNKSGMSEEVRHCYARGVPVAGICGGYQMLGHTISDEYGIESDQRRVAGIGLLECETRLNPSKVTVQVKARVEGEGSIFSPVRGANINGYEIHMGETVLFRGAKEAFRIIKRGSDACDISDGCVSKDGLVFGTYIHGLFDNGALRKSLIDYIKSQKGLGADSSGIDYSVHRQEQLDYLADTVINSLDIESIEGIIGAGVCGSRLR
ncbi:MAG TPA: cobyric acid synthase [Candidatus Aquicultor sp.]|jgi:adenosylcobyric acid synthase